MNKDGIEDNCNMTVWINEEDKIISFHKVPGYEELKIKRTDYFSGVFQGYIEKSFRFQ